MVDMAVIDMERGPLMLRLYLKLMLSQDTMVDMDVAMVVMAVVMVDMVVMAVGMEVTEVMAMESDLLSLDIMVSIVTTGATVDKLVMEEILFNCNFSMYFTSHNKL